MSAAIAESGAAQRRIIAPGRGANASLLITAVDLHYKLFMLA
jgi:hypothetical protein